MGEIVFWVIFWTVWIIGTQWTFKVLGDRNIISPYIVIPISMCPIVNIVYPFFRDENYKKFVNLTSKKYIEFKKDLKKL